jgi:hypothetical protein
LEILTVIAPFKPPLQLTSVFTTPAFNAAPGLTVTGKLVLHPLISLTVTVYVAAVSPLKILLPSTVPRPISS